MIKINENFQNIKLKYDNPTNTTSVKTIKQNISDQSSDSCDTDVTLTVQSDDVDTENTTEREMENDSA